MVVVGDVCGDGTYILTSRECSVASDRLRSEHRFVADRRERARVTVQEKSHRCLIVFPLTAPRMKFIPCLTQYDSGKSSSGSNGSSSSNNSSGVSFRRDSTGKASRTYNRQDHRIL